MLYRLRKELSKYLRELFHIEQKGHRPPETFALLCVEYLLQFLRLAVDFRGMNPIFYMVGEY